MVDQVHNDIAIVEITDSTNSIVNAAMPLALFPCSIKEGDFFYFEYIDGVTEVRCGEPPE